MPAQRERPLLEATLETSEVVIDALVADKVLSEIPIIGTAIKICKAVDDIRNRAFASKLARFVSGFSSETEETRDKWRERLAASPEETRRVGETLFFILERLTDFDKPMLLSRLFLAFVDQVISGEELRRLAQAIDSSFIDDLYRLMETAEIPSKSQEAWMRNMATSGLTQIVAGKTYDEIGELYFEVSPLGDKLRNAFAHGRRYDSQVARPK